MTNDQYDKISQFETQTEEQLVNVELKDGSGFVDALTFIQPENQKFVYPCFALLNSIAQSDAMYYKDDQGDTGW